MLDIYVTTYWYPKFFGRLQISSRGPLSVAFFALILHKVYQTRVVPTVGMLEATHRNCVKPLTATGAHNADQQLHNAQNWFLSTEEKIAALNQRNALNLKEYEARLKAAEGALKNNLK